MLEIKDKDDLIRICDFEKAHRELLFQKLDKIETDCDISVRYFLEDCLEFPLKNIFIVNDKSWEFYRMLNDFEVLEPIKVVNRLELFNLYYEEYLINIDDKTLSNFIDRFLSIVNKDNRDNLNLGTVVFDVLILDKCFIDENFNNGKTFESICEYVIESIENQLNKIY